jgi:lysophospholipase L1-like esterase
MRVRLPSAGEVAGRAALAAGGLVVGLVLLELFLRAAALVAPHLLDRAAHRVTADGVRILCVGDSHTYGAMVASDGAYPEQLERVLRRHGIPAAAFNLGIPGQNSRQVRNRLPRQLEAYRPDVVMLWAGVNDYWNVVGREADGGTVGANDELRIVRFWRLLRLALADEATARRPELHLLDNEKNQRQVWRWTGADADEIVEMRAGAAQLTPDEAAATVTDDLAAMIATVRAAGAVPVVVTYPFGYAPNGAAVNRAIVDVATRAHVLLVDTRVPTQALLDRHFKNLAFPDMHPTARLYRAIAWTMARALTRAHLTAPQPHRDRT